MTHWRPEPSIQTKAIGLVWREGKLLATQIMLDNGQVSGVRPIGGHVEFGETWESALKREFLEELKIEVTVTGPPIVIENIYTHQGYAGHEIVFAAEAEIPRESLPGTGPIEFYEDNGKLRIASWYSLDELDTGKIELYPSGLKQILMKLS